MPSNQLTAGGIDRPWSLSLARSVAVCLHPWARASLAHPIYPVCMQSRVDELHCLASCANDVLLDCPLQMIWPD